MRGIVFWICTILMQEDCANRKRQTSWIDFQSVDSPKSNVLRASKSTGTSEQWVWGLFFYNKLPAIMTEDLTCHNLRWDVEIRKTTQSLHKKVIVCVRISSRKWKHVLDSFGKRQRKKKRGEKKCRKILTLDILRSQWMPVFLGPNATCYLHLHHFCLSSINHLINYFYVSLLLLSPFCCSSCQLLVYTKSAKPNIPSGEKHTHLPSLSSTNHS